jgi:hypothetical protein
MSPELREHAAREEAFVRAIVLLLTGMLILPSVVVGADFGITATGIISPPAFVRIGDNVIPVVTVHADDGSPQPETVAARLRIGSTYVDTVRWQLNPGTTIPFHFKPWLPNALGTFSVSCSLLVHDSLPANDTLSRNVTVLAKLVDFSPTAIATTPPIVHLNDMVIPAVTVHANDSNPETETVAVRLRIGSFYDDTTNAELDPGEFSSVAFKPWQADSLGTFQLRCSLLVQDSAPANDTLSRGVTVYPPGSDFAVIAITSPPDTVLLDSEAVPAALIHAAPENQGESVSVRLQIGTSYDHTTDTVIPAGAAINVVFPSWQAQPLGVTMAGCTLLTPDNDSTNNAASKQVRVRRGQPLAWTRTFAGWGTTHGNCVEQTADGGYIAAGGNQLKRQRPALGSLRSQG